MFVVGMVWWHMSIVPAIRKQRQEDCSKCEASLSQKRGQNRAGEMS